MKDIARALVSPVSASARSTNRCPRRAILASLTAITAVALTGVRQSNAQSSTPGPVRAEATPERTDITLLLPRDAILSVVAVQEIIPGIDSETNTGPNATAVGTPIANRAVTFATADDAHHVVLSVDLYRTADEAGYSFNEALEASKNVPGVTSTSISDLGQAALIGVVTQGNETHVGGGALFGNLIVTATLQFYEGTDENKKKVVELIRTQAAHAEQTLDPDASATPAS